MSHLSSGLPGMTVMLFCRLPWELRLVGPRQEGVFHGHPMNCPDPEQGSWGGHEKPNGVALGQLPGAWSPRGSEGSPGGTLGLWAPGEGG